MAERLGVSRQAVSKWETGLSNPNTENLICLAEIFHVSVEELTHPNTRVELVLDLRKEIDLVKEKTKKMKFIVAGFLFLFIGTFIAALVTRFNGYDSMTVLFLIILSCIFMLLAFLPIMITILRLVYRDCKQRGIKPVFWVFISISMVGLMYYILKRDYLLNNALGEK